MHFSNCTPLPPTQNNRVVASPPPEWGKTESMHSKLRTVYRIVHRIMHLLHSASGVSPASRFSVQFGVITEYQVKSTCSHRSSKQQDLAYLVREHGYTDVTTKACTLQVIMISETKGVAAYLWKPHGSIFAWDVSFHSAYVVARCPAEQRPLCKRN